MAEQRTLNSRVVGSIPTRATKVKGIVMKDSHKKIADDLFTRHSIIMTEKGSIAPVYILILSQDRTLPVVLNTNLIGLEQYSEAVSKIAKDLDAEAVMFLCEQYMVSKPKDSPEANALVSGQIKPSEHPDKEEYLALIYMDQTGHNETCIAKIYTDPSGTRYTNDSRWINKGATNMIKPWKETQACPQF